MGKNDSYYDSTSTKYKRQKERDDTSTPPLLLLRLLRGCQNEHVLYDSSLRCGNVLSLSLSLSEERRSLAKSRVVHISIVLRKGVFALFAFVKHRLPFVCASQLHGVKPQHPMFALWTRLVYGCSRLLDVVVVPFVPYFRPVWVARFDVKFVQKAGGVRGRRLNRRRTLLLPFFFPSATGAEHPLGRVRQRATRARNRRRRRAQVHRASTPRARRRHQSVVGVQTSLLCRLLLLVVSSSQKSLECFVLTLGNNTAPFVVVSSSPFFYDVVLPARVAVERRRRCRPNIERKKERKTL